MNVNVFSTKDYENVSLRRRGKNKPNQTQFQRQKMLLRLTINGWRESFGYLRSFCSDKIREAIYLNDQSKHYTKIPHRSGV